MELKLTVCMRSVLYGRFQWSNSTILGSCGRLPLHLGLCIFAENFGHGHCLSQFRYIFRHSSDEKSTLLRFGETALYFDEINSCPLHL